MFWSCGMYWRNTALILFPSCPHLKWGAGVVGHQWDLTFTVFRVAAPLALGMAPPVPACFHDCPQHWGPLEILRNYAPSLLLSRRSRHAGYQLSAANQRNCLELVGNTERAHSSEIRKWWVGFLCTHLPTPLFFASNLASLMTYGFLRWGELNKVLVLSDSDQNTIFIIEIFKRH